jgi:putative copper resistance protein D
VNAPTDPLLIAARLAEYLAAFAIFGGALFRSYAPSELRQPPGPLRRFGLPVMAGVAALAWALAIARQIADASPFALLPTVLLQTGFGRALLAAAFLSLLLLLAGLGGRDRPRLTAALGGLLLAAPAFIGHAAGPGLTGAWRTGVKAVHLLAAGAWLGGLPPLALALRRGGASTPLLLRRFGRLGAVAVTAVLATGLVSVAFVTEIAGGSLGPLYLGTLAVKLAVVAVLLGLAAVNRLRLTPMVDRGDERGARSLQRTVLFEQLVALAVVVSVAFLGELDPAM